LTQTASKSAAYAVGVGVLEYGEEVEPHGDQPDLDDAVKSTVAAVAVLPNDADRALYP
jgi:hypothetical protein